MTELPPENTQIFGFGSRKFRMNSNEQKPGRSLWTDTPNSKPKEVSKIFVDFEKEKLLMNMICIFVFILRKLQARVHFLRNLLLINATKSWMR